MNKGLKIVLLLLTLWTAGGCDNSGSTQVYVCKSRGAKRYHLKANCRGLSNCTYEVIQMTREEAEKQGKTRCKWEK